MAASWKLDLAHDSFLEAAVGSKVGCSVFAAGHIRMPQCCFASWSLSRLMSSRPSLLQLCGLQKGDKDLPAQAGESLGVWAHW